MTRAEPGERYKKIVLKISGKKCSLKEVGGGRRNSIFPPQRPRDRKFFPGQETLNQRAKVNFTYIFILLTRTMTAVGRISHGFSSCQNRWSRRLGELGWRLVRNYPR